MAITYFATAVNPADNTHLDDGAERSITPPASMVAGDLVVLTVTRRGQNSITLNQLGGQTWTSETLRQSGSGSMRRFWCRFNGTWSANPSVTTLANAANTMTIQMDVFRPTAGTNTWAADVAEASVDYSVPVSPFDVTATGQTTVANNTVTLATWHSYDTNTWALQTAGWSNAGSAYYRNPDPTFGKKLSLSTAYKIQTSAGTTGNVTNRQLTLGGDSGIWVIETWKEQSSGVTVASAGDALFHHGETGITVAGTSFGASHTGSADIIISPSNNIADAGAVVQTQTAWGDTSVTFTANLSGFSYFTTLYLFVKNSSGASNSSGFAIKRERMMQVSMTLKGLTGTAAASLTGIQYSVCATDLSGAVVQSGTNATTDGSGVITLPIYTTIEGGALAGGGDVLVTLFNQGANQAASKGTCVQVTPTYS